VRVRKKTPKKQKRSRIELPPCAVVYGRVTSTTINGIPALQVHGLGGPYTGLVARKGAIEIVLPSATILNVSSRDEYVAWDGEEYLLRCTLESILETDNLQLIGKVNDLRHQSSRRPADAHSPATPRMAATITSPTAVRKMEAYLQTNGIGLTEFATHAEPTDRTLRSFRKTGTVRRQIFESIAKAMGVSKQDLLKG
jgi:hypothetical protein